ncbi:MAG: hypothetical protein ACUZ8O_09870 [Candidatus Anammoxibacter sp.]
MYKIIVVTLLIAACVYPVYGERLGSKLDRIENQLDRIEQNARLAAAEQKRAKRWAAAEQRDTKRLQAIINEKKELSRTLTALASDYSVGSLERKAVEKAAIDILEKAPVPKEPEPEKKISVSQCLIDLSITYPAGSLERAVMTKAAIYITEKIVKPKTKKDKQKVSEKPLTRAELFGKNIGILFAAGAQARAQKKQEAHRERAYIDKILNNLKHTLNTPFVVSVSAETVKLNNRERKAVKDLEEVTDIKTELAQGFIIKANTYPVHSTERVIVKKAAMSLLSKKASEIDGEITKEEELKHEQAHIYEIIAELISELQHPKSITLNESTRERIATDYVVGDVVSLEYNGGVKIYKESNLNKVAFKVPAGVQAKIIESITKVSPKLYKVEMAKGTDIYTGWVTAYVVHKD